MGSLSISCWFVLFGLVVWVLGLESVWLGLGFWLVGLGWSYYSYILTFGLLFLVRVLVIRQPSPQTGRVQVAKVGFGCLVTWAWVLAWVFGELD